MKREESIKILQELWRYEKTDKYTCSEIRQALDTAIKAIESKDVLDKIRAEIYRKAHSGQWSDATMYGMLKAVAIIDKHRAESEDNA